METTTRYFCRKYKCIRMGENFKETAITKRGCDRFTALVINILRVASKQREYSLSRKHSVEYFRPEFSLLNLERSIYSSLVSGYFYLDTHGQLQGEIVALSVRVQKNTVGTWTGMQPHCMC